MSTTYVVRTSTAPFYATRSSETMAYTHALLGHDDKGEGPISWHKSLDAARKAEQAATKWYKHPMRVVEVEKHDGTKATVEKRLAKEAAAPVEAPKADPGTVTPETPHGTTKVTMKDAPAKKAEPAKKATAGARAIPTEAANKARQAYLTEVGMDRYRQQYNSGWDAATAGQGVKKAASGTASVAWMDGYTDRVANPGKAGIASKWAALRATTAPVKKVDAPAEEPKPETPAKAAAKAPAKGRKSSTKAKFPITGEAVIAGAKAAAKKA